MKQDELRQRGWVRLSTHLSSADLTSLAELIPDGEYGVRLADFDNRLMQGALSHELSTLGFVPIPIRAVGFSKTDRKNWSLPWHQDRVIVRNSRTDDPRFTNWTLKGGLWHCEADECTLSDMAFAYIAIDPVGPFTGGLEIAEKTHHKGKIRADQIAYHISEATIVSPSLDAGDVLLIQALTLHRSATLGNTRIRRALRLDFARNETLAPAQGTNLS